MTYGEALASGRGALQRNGIASAGLDARLLLADAAGIGMAALIARAPDLLPTLADASFRNHILRRAAGEPVARILGKTEFWGLPFKVNAATLLPRADTETLVAAVLEEAQRLPPEISICDLGTGSGAIVIALLRELPQARAVATDISEDALQMARRNAETLGVLSRLRLRNVGFAEEQEGPFHVVVSNPPYIRSDVIPTLEREVRDHEPLAALDGGPDGFAAYRTILAQAGRLMAAGGILGLEVGFDQSETVAALCRGAGLGAVTIRRDLSGNARVVIARSGVSEINSTRKKKRLEISGESG
jgi:release factor glutamine methyltransferase